MKCQTVILVLMALSVSTVGACRKPVDFTGFWKANCTDAFGVQVKKQAGNLFSVSFCGPGGCFAPGEWKPNTPIVGDPSYRVINATTIEIGHGENWTRYTKCTTDINPKLDYSTMPSANNETDTKLQASPPNPENMNALAQKDPHRPDCSDAACRKVETFMKRNYCGESPAGNGPDDGCDTRNSKGHLENVKVIADYNCEWNETKNEAECKQDGVLDSELRGILIRHLEKLGMPLNAPGEILFKVWQPSGADWLATQAYYSNRVGGDIELCEVIAVVDKKRRVTALRELPFRRTDSDVPNITDWTLLDIADTRGNGQADVILEGGAYEDHWFEVISLQNGKPKTIFSGLGYYL